MTESAKPSQGQRSSITDAAARQIIAAGRAETDKKTIRLRALRLARDAAEQEKPKATAK